MRRLPPFLAALTAAFALQDPGELPFAPRAHADFGDATAPLREFLRVNKVRTTKAQHFCIAGYQSADGSDRRAWVHWTEGRKIVLWTGATDPASALTAIANSRRTIDLNKHVVKTDAELRGSTYLVTRAWVDRLIADCKARGERYEVSRTRERK